MNLQKGKSKGNMTLYYQRSICFNCSKQVNLKNTISSKTRDDYRYIMCDCGQIMKVVKNDNEENIVKIKRDGKEIKEAYELFFTKEDNEVKKVNKKIKKNKTFKNFIESKKKKIKSIKREKRKSKLTLIKGK